jgi:hypothetical protein
MANGGGFVLLTFKTSKGKYQIPNPNFQINSKFQPPMIQPKGWGKSSLSGSNLPIAGPTRLEFELSFSGIYLGFGIWNLVLI